MFKDGKDKLQTTTMKEKMISVVCPILFTEGEANLAKVKNLKKSLTHTDKKMFPIYDVNKLKSIYSTILSVLGDFDIKLVHNEFSNINNSGEGWYYGETKVNRDKLITYFALDGNRQALEIQIFGDKKEQITGYLAKIGEKIRKQLIEHNIITSNKKFYSMRISVLSSECPYCGAEIPAKLVEKYKNRNSIKCKHCDLLIPEL